MQRYTMEAVSFYGYAPHVEADTCDGGDWVRADEAQAEIARLQAELDDANACHETALSLANFGEGQIERLQAEVERLNGANAEVVELFHDNTWNDAIEAAASEMEHHHSEEGDSLLCTIWQERILALKRPT